MLNPAEKECLDACNACIAACLQCASSNITGNNPELMARCISLTLECADICRLVAASIARNGEHIKAICALCADICHACEGECASHKMEHCQECAEACKRCAEACRNMIWEFQNSYAPTEPSLS